MIHYQFDNILTKKMSRYCRIRIQPESNLIGLIRIRNSGDYRSKNQTRKK